MELLFVNNNRKQGWNLIGVSGREIPFSKILAKFFYDVSEHSLKHLRCSEIH